MKTFTVMRGYTIKAANRWEAKQVFNELEAQGKIDQYFKFESIKEDEQHSGWYGAIKKQVTGK